MDEFQTYWETSGNLPDEEYLHAEWQAEVDNYKNNVESTLEMSQRQIEQQNHFLRMIGITDEEIQKTLDNESTLAKEGIKKAEERLEIPNFDADKFQSRELELASSYDAYLSSLPTPQSSGHLRTISGFSHGHCGTQCEFIPRFDKNRFDLALSTANTSITSTTAIFFPFEPKRAGLYQFTSHIWQRGYRMLRSDSSLYPFSVAGASLVTTITVWQDFWRLPNYQERLRYIYSGSVEISDRIDQVYTQDFTTYLEANRSALVDIRLIFQTDSRGPGSYSILNCSSNSGLTSSLERNYYYLPYIRWHLQ